MKTLLDTLFENVVYRTATAPTFFKLNADRLRPAKEVLSPEEMFVAKEEILKETSNKKGHKYYMLDDTKLISLTVLELDGKRYSLKLSADNDSFHPMKDFNHVEDFLRALKIDLDLFKQSKL